MRPPEKTYREKENGSKTASWKRVIVQGIGRGEKQRKLQEVKKKKTKRKWGHGRVSRRNYD